MRIQRSSVWWCSGLAIALSAAAFSVHAFEPSPGDAVEVREGDIWSPAEFIKKEGRRLQIRYDDGTEEWITADRLRAVGGVSDGPAATPEREKPRRFRTGQEVELKRHSRWVEAEVKRASPPLYLIATKQGIGVTQFHWEWVDAPRLRTPGEDHEGPDVFSQFGHSVHNDSIRDSLRKAKEAFADHEKKESQTTRDDSGKRDPFAPPPFAHPVSEADRLGMEITTVSPGRWGEVLVDPADETIQRPRTLSLKSGENRFFEKPVVMQMSGTHALVVIEDTPPGKATTIYAEKVDIARGRVTGAVEFDAAALPRALSPGGERLASVANGFHIGSKNRLDVWDWSARQPKHLVSFAPFDDRQKSQADIEQVLFVDADTVVVSNRRGVVSAWDATTGRGLWEVSGLDQGSDVLALTPGGEWLAALADGRAVLLDVRTGEVGATLPGADFRVRSLSFSPDGQTLVAGGRNLVKGWDLLNRVSWPSIGLRPGESGPPVAADSGLVFAGGWVYDLKTGQPIWGYDMDQDGVSRVKFAAHAGSLVRIGKSTELKRDAGPAFVLTAWPLPGRAAKGIDQARAGMDSPTMLLQPGDRVSVDVSKVEASGAEREAIKNALVDQLEGRGVLVADGQAVRVVGVTTTESEQRVYESRGRNPFEPELTKVDAKTRTTRLAIEIDGQPAWAVTSMSQPGWLVTREQGQSVQEAVDASARHDAAGFLNRVKLPDLIPDPREAPEGSTVLSD
ncbi:PQQ-binding-like beta-propeller repeat protein [Algisphaera agarilytica]|uniref:Uncharacterized protein n=1 Tax=Algisphaera agarilytica TaxID=1385975 RepID=A0A7X0LKX7_9BACT|nr:PQQ-binding-like beta-propeller repeat protein [Algisphaera agarilytica]MBB6429408.1 hypothetical protein [Algisphaera agarilytica]